MIKTVNTYSVISAFSSENTHIYRIPKYQREYTWGMKEWDALFNDIVENDDGYFLGSFICVSSGALNNTVELIDGQQRFTTLSIFLLSLYEKLSAFKDEFDDDEMTEYNNLKNQIANKSSEKVNGKKVVRYSPKLILQSQNHNEDDYNSLFEEAGIPFQVQRASNRGNRRIYKAYKHFKVLIEKYIADVQKEDQTLTESEIIFSLRDKFNSAVLVGIEVDSHRDAYMLFESLNNRGVPLSAVDLIKNIIISASEKDGKQDDCYNQWLNILSNIGDDYSDQERFLRYYYNAFREELNEPFKAEDSTRKYPLGYLATRTTLLDIFERLIKKNYQFVLNELKSKSEIYSIITNRNTDEKVYSQDLINLEHIQGTPSYQLLLYLICYQDELSLSESNISDVIKLLIKFFVRRNTTDIPNTRNLNKIFLDIIENVNKLSGNKAIEYIRSMLIEVSASDEQFMLKLSGPLYDENYDATRFILCSIEEEHQTKEIHTDLWKRDNSKKYIWTIEHVFPEGENIPKCWVDMIANGNRDKANEYLSQYVHKLGNLTISGYNSTLGNQAFEEKMNKKNKEGKYVGYKNGLFLNSDIVTQNTWSVEYINERTDKIVSLVMNLFKW